jgi:D-serine deaminase-like pyridoxal phosphate-dependent protein
VAEIEHMLPMLLRPQTQGRRKNVLYAVPLPPSQVHRLALIGKQLDPNSIILILDHASQLLPLRSFHGEAGFPADAFLKVDTRYHRAGLPPHALNKDNLVQKLIGLEAQGFV